MAIWNPVQRADSADGAWRTLDSRTLHNQRLAVVPVTDRGLEGRLSALGYAMMPRADGNGAEIGGVSQDVMDLFRSRAVAVTGELEKLAQEYTEHHGKPPSRSFRRAAKGSIDPCPARARGGETRGYQQKIASGRSAGLPETRHPASAVPCAHMPGCGSYPEPDNGRQDGAAAQQNSKERFRPMKRLLHRSKLIILTMALASGGLAVSVIATLAAHAATHPAAAVSPLTHPPDPC